jgi:hypothetical protein
MRPVVRMAAMVPIGIDFWASLKSPDLLEPAMIPAGGREVNLITSSNSCTMYTS